MANADLFSTGQGGNSCEQEKARGSVRHFGPPLLLSLRSLESGRARPDSSDRRDNRSGGPKCRTDPRAFSCSQLFPPWPVLKRSALAMDESKYASRFQIGRASCRERV